MPIDYKDYPDNWSTTIRPRILARATGADGVTRCERCGVPNGVWVWYHPHPDCAHVWTINRTKAATWYGPQRMYRGKYPEGHTVVLTIAHVRDPNPHSTRPDNLQALCQTCHLRLDAQLHAMNRRRKKNAEQEAAGQLRLFKSTN